VFRRRDRGSAVEEFRRLGAGRRVGLADSLMSDIHASADYRANLVVVMAKRAVAAAKG
jgi:CO/xanthine dehydrogenase FAD-binding subunit